MKFSISDYYQEFDKPTTNDRTIPDSEERAFYNDNIAYDSDGMANIVPKNLIFGALVLVVGIMLVLKVVK